VHALAAYRVTGGSYGVTGSANALMKKRGLGLSAVRDSRFRQTVRATSGKERSAGRAFTDCGRSQKLLRERRDSLKSIEHPASMSLREKYGNAALNEGELV
jgi:hypothetical protein